MGAFFYQNCFLFGFMSKYSFGFLELERITNAS